MTDEQPVGLEVHDGVATITIDRPDQRNAVNVAVNRALLDAFARVRDDGAVAVVVLTGAGDRAFCAGGDLGGMRPDAGAVEQHRGRARFAEVLQAVRELGKPVIGRINGHALAGGFGLALACHLLVASEDATFGTTEVKVGMWPYMISTVLTDHLGPKRALELMLTGRRLSAAEALDLGLVNRVVPAAELDRAVAELSADLRAKSPVVLSLGLQAWATAGDMRRDEALAYLAGMLTLHLQTDDVAEGVAAFLEKRPPRWTGR